MSQKFSSLKLDAGNYFVNPIPSYISQFASRELVSDYLDKHITAEDDPLWKSFGFKLKADYNFWVQRLCGLICVKMVLDALSLSSTKETIAELTKKGVSVGGYQVYNEDGVFIDKGWFYAPLIELSKEYGVNGNVCKNLTIFNLCQNVLYNKFSIASVNPKVIRGDIDKCKTKGGHLVIILGFKWNGKKCDGFYIHNPSGREPSTQENAYISLERFTESFAQRGFTLFSNEIKN